MLVLRMVEEQFHRDTEGRPIREGRTPPELLRDGEIEYRQCPYPGSRYLNERPMNASALRQTSAHWDEVVDTVALLRTAYSEARGGYCGDVMDIWRVSQLGSALPWFYILHRGQTCPAYAAALSKATLGVGIWGHRVFADLLADRTPGGRFTAQQMLDTAEHTGTLVADHEVCAASDKMMLKFFEPFTADEVRVTGAGEVGRLAGARDELVRFGAHYLGFKQWIWLYWLARRALYADLIAVLGRLPELVDRLDPTGEPPDFSLIEPGDIAALPVVRRAQWFAGLANLVEPFARDGSDAALRGHAFALAQVMGQDPAGRDDIAAEVARVLGTGAEASAQVARAVGTYAALDGVLADVLATVEAGFRGPAAPAIDASVRDRVIGMPPRAVFARFAPASLAAITRR